MQCIICNHEKVAEIEEALLCRNWGDSKITLESIAEEYHVDVRSLQVHSVMHLPVQNVTGGTESITEKIKLNEAEILRQVASEYFITLRNVGQKVNNIVNSNDPSMSVQLKTPLVELYLGCGSKIRESVEGLIKLNQSANGEANTGLNALAQLVSNFRNPPKDNDDDTIPDGE